MYTYVLVVGVAAECLSVGVAAECCTGRIFTYINVRNIYIYTCVSIYIYVSLWMWLLRDAPEGSSKV